MKTATIAAALGIVLAGCFNEPEPASKTVPEGTRVYLQDRGLENLSSSADALKEGEKIDYLNLDRNKLKEFPPEIARLSGLKWLRLNRNSLSKLPDLSALVNLRRIYLRENHFTSVPEELKNLPALTDIDLSGNPIRTIPDWLAAKKGLEGLSFNGTMVEKLPEDISAWKSLKQLQLGDLRLSPDEMKRIRQALPDTAIVF
jgi:Leucine-rich repeat (LRR) protein